MGRSRGESWRFGWRGDAPDRTAGCVGHQRAFRAEFASVDGRLARCLTAAGCLDQAAVHGDLLELEPDDAVVGLQAQLLQRREDPGSDPFVPAGAYRGGRARVVGDLDVRGAEHQSIHELVEDDPVGDPRPVATQRVGVDNGWDQCLELVPDRLNEPRWDGGHGGT